MFILRLTLRFTVAFGLAVIIAAGCGAGGATAAAAGFAGGAAAGAWAWGLTAAGFGKVERTAVWQAGDNAATCFCKHISASRPPGETPEHFDMKSERQLARSALFCAGVICASAGVAPSRPNAHNRAQRAGMARPNIDSECIYPPVFGASSRTERIGRRRR